MAFSKTFIAELKRRNSLPDVVSRFVPLKRAGSNLVGRCPFHNEKTPSFTVFPATESYFCFGCGAGGDVITFEMQAEGLDYREAVEQLAKMAGIPVEEDDPQGNRENAPSVRRDRLLSVNREAARFFRSHLLSPAGEKARAYLAKRGFSETTIKRFGIGCAPDAWDELCKHLTGLGYSGAELSAAFLGRQGKNGSYYDLFRNRVMFPIFDLTGEVCAFSGRRLNEEEERKYVNTSDTPVFRKGRILFGMNFAKNSASEGLILCEGAPDCIALHQAGFGNAVATLGTAITGEHARLIARFTKRVFLAYDIDRAGRKATLRGMELLNQVGVETKVISLGEGDSKDPDEYIRNHGAAAFREKLTGSEGQIDYRIGEILSRHDLTNPDALLRCGSEMAAFLATISNPMERDICCSRAAERMKVSPAALKEETEKQRRISESKSRRQEKKAALEAASGYGDTVNRDRLRYSAEAPHEEAVLGILLLHPEFGVRAAKELTAEDFATGFNRKLWELFSADFAAGEEPELTAGGVLTVKEAGAAEGYRAMRVSLGGNTEEELFSRIGALKRLRTKKEYEKQIEESPADGLEAYLQYLRKKRDAQDAQ